MSDIQRTESAFAKVIAWAEAHPEASWKEAAKNAFDTLAEEMAVLERGLAALKAERAALQAKPDVAGLVNSIRALRSARHEWENAPSSELLTLDAAIDALLSLSAQLAEANETWTDEKGTCWARPTAWAYAQACRALHEKEAELVVFISSNGNLTNECLTLRAECAGLRADAACNRAALGFMFDAMVINSGNVGEIRDDWTLPMACQWNAWVRDLTAERENQPPRHSSDIDAAIDSARKEST